MGRDSVMTDISGRTSPGGRGLVRRTGAGAPRVGRRTRAERGGSALDQPGPTTTSGYHQVMRRSGAVSSESAKTGGAESGSSSTAGGMLLPPEEPDEPAPPLLVPPASSAQSVRCRPARSGWGADRPARPGATTTSRQLTPRRERGTPRARPGAGRRAGRRWVRKSRRRAASRGRAAAPGVRGSRDRGPGRCSRRGGEGCRPARGPRRPG